MVTISSDQELKEALRSSNVLRVWLTPAVPPQQFPQQPTPCQNANSTCGGLLPTPCCSQQAPCCTENKDGPVCSTYNMPLAPGRPVFPPMMMPPFGGPPNFPPPHFPPGMLPPPYPGFSPFPGFYGPPRGGFHHRGGFHGEHPWWARRWADLYAGNWIPLSNYSSMPQFSCPKRECKHSPQPFQARLVRDITIPKGTKVAPAVTF